jgi:hypothetical protein
LKNLFAVLPIVGLFSPRPKPVSPLKTGRKPSILTWAQYRQFLVNQLPVLCGYYFSRNEWPKSALNASLQRLKRHGKKKLEKIRSFPSIFVKMTGFKFGFACQQIRHGQHNGGVVCLVLSYLVVPELPQQLGLSLLGGGKNSSCLLSCLGLSCLVLCLVLSFVVLSFVGSCLFLPGDTRQGAG